RLGDDHGRGARSAHHAGGGDVPGAACRKGAQLAGRSRSRAGQRPRRGPPAWPPWRAPGQRASAEHGSGRSQIGPRSRPKPPRRWGRGGTRLTGADQKRNKGPPREALLEAPRGEASRAGKPGFFVGAAPGVGKTSSRVEPARARHKDGYDVVVG